MEEKEEKIYFLHTFCNNFRVSFCLLKCVGWNFFWKRDMWKRKYMLLTQLTILCKMKLKPLILIIACYKNCSLGLFFNFQLLQKSWAILQRAELFFSLNQGNIFLKSNGIFNILKFYFWAAIKLLKMHHTFVQAWRKNSQRDYFIFVLR